MRVFDEESDVIEGLDVTNQKMLPPAPQAAEVDYLAEMRRWANMDHILTCGG